MTAPNGPISALLHQRATFGPIEPLEHGALVHEQERSLASPRRHYTRSARALFATMDLVYGRARTLEKFRVLELVARVPYQAWENVAYVTVTHTATQPGFVRRVFDRVRTSRWEQDNEQWHLLLLEQITSSRRRGLVRGQLVPQVLAFGYYQLSWVLYVVRPTRSYRLNADFEDHAEHEYALLVHEHPEWDAMSCPPELEEEAARYDTIADLFRQVAYDERLHKLESEALLGAARFH